MKYLDFVMVLDENIIDGNYAIRLIYIALLPVSKAMSCLELLSGFV